jgi:beta-aspartyl-peptidase (threonine type)
MEKSNHVMLVGPAADRYALSMGCEAADEAYLIIPERLQRWQSLPREGGTEMDHAAFAAAAPIDGKYGTVGAVALDSSGTMAAATSTGGMTNKLPGRVGDTPIIGAGTLADDRSLAVSFTGTGEHMIRLSGARSMSALIQHARMPLALAAQTILEQLRELGGEGGLIAIDHLGNPFMTFNTPGMFRGSMDDSGRMHTAIYE